MDWGALMLNDTESFQVHRYDHYGTAYEPRLEPHTQQDGVQRLTINCACPARRWTLSSSQAKQCRVCRLLLARVGADITIVQVGR